MKYFKQLILSVILLGSVFQIPDYNALEPEKIPSYVQVTAIKKLMMEFAESFDINKKIEKQLMPMDCLGLDIDKKQGIYYSKLDPWEKEFGYDDLYDKVVPLLNKEKIEFKYDNKTWVIWLWKGYYIPVLGYGAEIGTYIRDPFKKFPIPKKVEYRGANEKEMLTVSYKLMHEGKELFHFEPQKHWWLAGYMPCDYIPSHQLEMEANITFLTEKMAGMFENAAKNHAPNVSNLQRECNTVKFSWK